MNRLILITFIFVLSIGCKPNMFSKQQITTLVPVEIDSSLLVIRSKITNQELFIYKVKSDLLIQFDVDKNYILYKLFVLKNDKILLVFQNLNGIHGRQLAEFSLNGELKIVMDLPRSYHRLQPALDGKKWFGIKVVKDADFNSNAPPIFQVDQMDSLFNFIDKVYEDEGSWESISGITSDSQYLLIINKRNKKDDQKGIAINISNPKQVTDLRDHESISNDSDFFQREDFFGIQPNDVGDSVYVVKYGKPDIFMFSASSGKYRKIESLGFNENKYSSVSHITKVNNLPFQALVASDNIILIRDTQTGKVTSIDPDRKPDIVIPLKIINPEKME